MLKHRVTMVTTKQSKQLDCFYSVHIFIAIARLSHKPSCLEHNEAKLQLKQPNLGCNNLLEQHPEIDWHKLMGHFCSN